MVGMKVKLSSGLSTKLDVEEVSSLRAFLLRTENLPCLVDRRVSLDGMVKIRTYPPLRDACPWMSSPGPYSLDLLCGDV
jgi:hypothetical protein